MKSKDGNRGMRMGLLIVALLVLALVVPSGEARANSITISGATSWTEYYSLVIGGTTLSATELFTVTSFSSSAVDLTATLTNTSTGPTTGWISSAGFNTAPHVTATFQTAGAGAILDNVINDTTFPTFGTIEVCLNATSGCSSGSNHDFTTGVSDTFKLHLVPNPSTPSFSGGLTLDTFVLKVGGGPSGLSYEFQGCGTGPCNPVPEPASLLLLGSGLAGLGLWGWKRRREDVQA